MAGRKGNGIGGGRIKVVDTLTGNWMSRSPGLHQALGKVVAHLLCGSWRKSPPPPAALSSERLDGITPLLLETGSAGLAWWRIRDSPLRNSPAAVSLRQAYRLQAIQAAILEDQLAESVRALRSSGIEPLLSKGWAVARLYPQPGLRAYRDIDLCVRLEDYTAANSALKCAGLLPYPVELKVGYPDLPDRTVEELFSRSQIESLNGEKVRILCAEDQLRHLCVHLLRHGITRPTWLCDIGVFMEQAVHDFDWDYCLSGSPRRTEWMGVALGLAETLLGASLENAPGIARDREIPDWIVSAVLRQWGTSCDDHRPFTASIRHPREMLGALAERWPDPISATVRGDGSFREGFTLRLQIAEYLRLAYRHLRLMVHQQNRERQRDGAGSDTRRVDHCADPPIAESAD